MNILNRNRTIKKIKSKQRFYIVLKTSFKTIILRPEMYYFGVFSRKQIK